MLTLTGLIHEVKAPAGVTAEQNLGGFFNGVFSGDFSTTCMAPLANAKIHLGVHMGIAGGFFPPLSLETDSGADGRFAIDIPPQLLALPQAKGFLVAFKEMGLAPRPNAAPIRLFQPIYRSEPFNLRDAGEGPLLIFGALIKTPDREGISAADINSQVATALEALAAEDKDVRKIKEMAASITPSGLHFDVRAAANTRGSFDLQLSPSTAASATRLADDLLLRTKITNVKTEKGNVFGRLCRSRVRLEAGISGQARTFTKSFSNAAVSRIRAALQEQGLEGAVAALLLDDCFSLAVAGVRFPLVDRRPPLPGSQRVLVLDVSFGYPRRLVGTPVRCNLPKLN
jgi:hypothetical protein